MKTIKTRSDKLLSAREMLQEDSRGYVSTTLDIPSGATTFKLENTKPVKVDLIPYIVGDNNPTYDKGNTGLFRSYYIHRNIGPDKAVILCPKKSYSKRCPICDEIDRLGWDDPVSKDLKTSWRQLWNLIDTNNPDAGIQVWDVAEWNFGKALKVADEALEEGDERRYYADPTAGATLKGSIVEESVPGRKFFKVERVDFIPRSKQYKDSIKRKAWCLDEIIKPPMKYDELKKLFLQTPDEEDSNEVSGNHSSQKKGNAMKRKSVTAKSQGIKKGSAVEHEDLGECVVTALSKDGFTLTLTDEEDDEHVGIGVSEVSLVEEDETPPKKTSKTKASTKTAKKGKKVIEDEDDDDDMDEDEDDNDSSELEDDDDEEEDDDVDEDEDNEEDEEEEDLDEEDEEEEEDEPAPKKRGRPVTKRKK